MNAQTSRNPWPLAIIGFFVVFITGMVIFIVFASGQRMDLVRADYYEEEVRYQQQLDRLNRTAVIRSEVAVSYDAARGQIRIALPASHAGQPLAGSIQFYRPSDAALDHRVNLSIDSGGVQQLDASKLQPGLWKVRVLWQVQDREYFFDQPVVVVGGVS